ncbi:hypothetical protein R8Z50_22545 [Longispora sp. K20-0274]|uniref:hypothetical protein n=1 Tax=Longispora sp. K20-0274 TaxID=3088255 RepID=UPI00399BCE99
MEHDNGCRQDMIAKACVSLANATVSQTVEEWIKRRTTLDSHGIVVPRLAFVYKATVYEEYVPLDFNRCLEVSTGAERAALLGSLGRTARIVGALGFERVPLHDARTHGSDCVIVDFGQDLGGPSRGTPARALAQVVNDLRQWRILKPNDADIIQAA